MAMMRLRREDPRVVGSFRLHRRLGAGGMGVVYLGSDRRGQRVALKVIRPDLAEAGMGTGHHGFAIRNLGGILPFSRHRVRSFRGLPRLDGRFLASTFMSIDRALE